MTHGRCGLHSIEHYRVYLQDKVGIDVKLLDEIQSRLLGLYRQPKGDPLTQHPSTIFQESVTTTLYKATMQLLDDLHSNCRMLGVPERCPICCRYSDSVLGRQPSIQLRSDPHRNCRNPGIPNRPFSKQMQ